MKYESSIFNCLKVMDQVKVFCLRSQRRRQGYDISSPDIRPGSLKIQLNMSKHVEEKCRKLCITSMLASKRGITPTKINVN